MDIDVGSAPSADSPDECKNPVISSPLAKRARKIRLPRNRWHDVNDNLKPKPYDLVRLKELNGRVSTGWYTDPGWDGLKIKKTSIIIEWMKPTEYMY